MDAKRVTVYFEEDLHLALRLKGAETGRSVSDLVNAAVRRFLAADAEDLATARARQEEPSLTFATVLEELRRRGKL